MMNSVIVIALTIACSNGVWANTIPTTVPPTTVTPTTVPLTTEEIETTFPTTLPPQTTTQTPTTPPPTSPTPLFTSPPLPPTTPPTPPPTSPPTSPTPLFTSPPLPPTTPPTPPPTSPPTSPTPLFTSPPLPPTTPPPTTTPPVCYVDPYVSVAVGQTHVQARDDLCWFSVCSNPPYADTYTECYDSSIVKCVTDGEQIKNGLIRFCQGSYWSDWLGGSLEPTTTTPGCMFDGVQYPYGDIPDSGGCICDTSGDVACPGKK